MVAAPATGLVKTRVLMCLGVVLICLPSSYFFTPPSLPLMGDGVLVTSKGSCRGRFVPPVGGFGREWGENRKNRPGNMKMMPRPLLEAGAL